MTTKPQKVVHLSSYRMSADRPQPPDLARLHAPAMFAHVLQRMAADVDAGIVPVWLYAPLGAVTALWERVVGPRRAK